MDNNFKTKIVKIDIPVDHNIIFGHSHFIKTVEDLYETLISSSPSLNFETSKPNKAVCIFINAIDPVG